MSQDCFHRFSTFTRPPPPVFLGRRRCRRRRSSRAVARDGQHPLPPTGQRAAVRVPNVFNYVTRRPFRVSRVQHDVQLVAHVVVNAGVVGATDQDALAHNHAERQEHPGAEANVADSNGAGRGGGRGGGGGSAAAFSDGSAT